MRKMKPTFFAENISPEKGEFEAEKEAFAENDVFSTNKMFPTRTLSASTGSFRTDDGAVKRRCDDDVNDDDESRRRLFFSRASTAPRKSGKMSGARLCMRARAGISKKEEKVETGRSAAGVAAPPKPMPPKQIQFLSVLTLFFEAPVVEVAVL